MAGHPEGALAMPVTLSASHTEFLMLVSMDSRAACDLSRSGGSVVETLLCVLTDRKLLRTPVCLRRPRLGQPLRRLA